MSTINMIAATATESRFVTGDFSGLHMADCNLAENKVLYDHLVQFIGGRCVGADTEATIAARTADLMVEVDSLIDEEQTDAVRLAIADKRAEIARITKAIKEAAKARLTFQFSPADKEFGKEYALARNEESAKAAIRKWADTYGLTYSELFVGNMNTMLAPVKATNNRQFGKDQTFVKGQTVSAICRHLYNVLAQVACYDLGMFTAFQFSDDATAFYDELRRKDAEVAALREARKAEREAKKAERARKVAERAAKKAENANA